MIIGVDFVDLDFFLFFFIIFVKMWEVCKNTIQLNSTPQVAKLGKTTPGIRIERQLNWNLQDVCNKCNFNMNKFQLRLSTRNRNGSWTHQYSKLYNSVAEAFANPAFAAYVQQHHVGEYHTIKVLSVNVADANV